MVGPMKKKVISSVFVTAIVLILIFVGLAFLYISSTNKKIADLEVKSEVVQRYVLVNDMTAGDVITATDVILVDVKGESAPSDSFTALPEMVGKRLKVNANAKTIVTNSLFFADDAKPEADTRLQEFNMITLPSDLDVGDYIDVRIRFATGEDYSVLVGKKIESFGASGTESNTIFLRLNEEEIVRMGSAIIESYIRDGILLYANRYVDPDNQLHEYSRVDYVAKYEDARYIESTNEPVVSIDESGEEHIVEQPKIERSIEEISVLIGLDIGETKNIQTALANNDNDTLSYYRDKLCTVDKTIISTYPVKEEVASLIAKNPNILNEVKTKYNIEELEQERINFLDTNMHTKDPYTGEIKIVDEYINNIQKNLEKEITLQRTERQEYLLNLMANK